jgi:hypothetical protein
VTRRFIMMTDALTEAEEQALAAAMEEPPVWWHWLPNSWLVVDRSDVTTATSIRDKFQAITSTKRCMVIEVDHKQWAGMTRPDSQGRSMTEWIEHFWVNG